ncbi:plasmid partitioning protein RepB [Brucella sp. NBRC 12950]|uniref:plasmid partitioning protein RepB n=1 Tax=Brucella sp. NBRC 12950 TaxID=2994518 RepID=UPI0024A18BB1|nr:plasmid partitioning protein RepB [Brucella sp. NBRC 12950]GLU29861.1 plasmid partitioning protein RepB [Brucella sp. NBRC 12950]
MSKRRDALRDYLSPIKQDAEFSAENSPRRPQVTSGALQSMNDAISGLSHEADALREALSSGSAIVELDASDIESSFVSDRLQDHNSEDFNGLLESIRENGQAVPVLVRPHPIRSGHYQLAYGHRRVAALKQLGLKVKAFVRELSDDELVIAQGSENLERKDLSFIEKVFFAKRLEDRGTSRAVIMATFGTRSKGVLSEMISLASKLPADIVEKIGTAPGVGRPRWESFSSLLSTAAIDRVRALIETEEFASKSSSDRFEAAFAVAKEPRLKDVQALTSWTSQDRRVEIVSRPKPKSLTLEFSSAEGKAFGDWISKNFERLHSEYSEGSRSTGD